MKQLTLVHSKPQGYIFSHFTLLIIYQGLSINPEYLTFHTYVPKTWVNTPICIIVVSLSLIKQMQHTACLINSSNITHPRIDLGPGRAIFNLGM